MALTVSYVLDTSTWAALPHLLVQPILRTRPQWRTAGGGRVGDTQHAMFLLGGNRLGFDCKLYPMCDQQAK